MSNNSCKNGLRSCVCVISRVTDRESVIFTVQDFFTYLQKMVVRVSNTLRVSFRLCFRFPGVYFHALKERFFSSISMGFFSCNVNYISCYTEDSCRQAIVDYRPK